MVTQLDNNLFFNTFGVNSFYEFEQNIQSMPPSMVEYYLSNLSDGLENSYLNRSNIQQAVVIDEYSLYLDYGDNIFLEFNKKDEEYETLSLW